MNLTFKQFLSEMQDEMTPQEAAMAQRKKNANPVRHAKNNAMRQADEARTAQKDDEMDPAEKALERKEADIARTQAKIAQKKEQGKM